MEEISALFDRLQTKCEDMDLAMSILPEKRSVYSDLDAINTDVHEIKNLEIEMKSALKMHQTNVMSEYAEAKDNIQRVTEKMLFLLSALEDKSKDSHRSVLQEIASPVPHLYDRPNAQKIFSETNTPHLSVLEYAKSPLIKKKNTKVKLHFTDFEAEISKNEFAKIPQYMRGRISQTELQDFLDKYVVSAFNQKYEIIHKARGVLTKPFDLELQKMFREQASYFDGKFITVGDLARIMEKNVEKRDFQMLTCLRHLSIIREIRKNSVVCYIWTKK